MSKWEYRADEVKHLLNPAFCGRVIYGTVTEYQKKTKRDFPYPLTYLILPLVLPRQIRTKINSRTQFPNWVQNHQEFIFNFWKRAKDLVEITNEAVEFMLQTGYMKLTDNGELSKDFETGALSKSKYSDAEVDDCLVKAENVGRWFATTGRIETIFISLGVRP